MSQVEAQAKCGLEFWGDLFAFQTAVVDHLLKKNHEVAMLICSQDIEDMDIDLLKGILSKYFPVLSDSSSDEEE